MLVIQGEVVLSVGKKMHMECFKCSYCKKALQKATAKLKDDRLCCPECMLKKDPSRRAINAAAAAAASGDADQIDDVVRVQATPTQATRVISAPSPTAASASSASAASAAAASAAPAAARPAVASSPKVQPAVIDHDAFTTYVKPQKSHKRKDSKVDQTLEATAQRSAAPLFSPSLNCSLIFFLSLCVSLLCMLLSVLRSRIRVRSNGRRVS
jgi:hypothetical protein